MRLWVRWMMFYSFGGITSTIVNCRISCYSNKTHQEREMRSQGDLCFILKDHHVMFTIFLDEDTDFYCSV